MNIKLLERRTRSASLRVARETFRSATTGTPVLYYKRISRKVPLKYRGLLTPKFPSGLRGALLLVRHPASANFPWDGWAVQVADHSPSGLLLFAMESIRIGIAIRLLTVVYIAIRRGAVRIKRLSFLPC